MIKYTIRPSARHGRGVWATLPISAGETIMVFGGPRLHAREVDFDDYHLQIDAEWYLGPSREADDYVNHSCDPNAGFRDGLTLVALRDIVPDEEITWDYSTAIDEADFAGFPCDCGAARCRGRVTSFRHLSVSEQQRLAALALPYLRRRYLNTHEKEST